MSKSDYLENKLLDHTLGGPVYTRPSTVYVSLHSADVTDAGTGPELAGSGYTRVAVVNNATNWPAAVAGAKSNGVGIAFPTATAGWVTATHFGIWSSSSGGNLLRHGVLTTPVLAQSGDAPYFPPGSLICTET